MGRGELGYSFAYTSPVWPLLRNRGGHTLLLTLISLVCSWLIAIPIGVWAADRRGRWYDKLSGAGTSLLLAIPDVLFGLGLIALALHTGWFPTGGMYSPSLASLAPMVRAKDLAHHLILPVAALVAGMLPVLV